MKPFENAHSGFNHNIKHKGQIYHIQTEDSGKHNPTVTTLLFLGGNILASLKASYAEHLEFEDLPQRVRELMEAQHKQMLRNLLKGQYDKQNELQAKHWKVGQLDEYTVDTAKQPALVPEHIEKLSNDIQPSPTSSPVLEATPVAPGGGGNRPSRLLPAVEEPPPSPVLEATPVSPGRGVSRPSRPLPVVGEKAPPSPLILEATPVSSPGGGSRPSRPLPVVGEKAPPPAFEEEMRAVFGEDLVYEKRLDELILNYLLGEKDKPS